MSERLNSGQTSSSGRAEESASAGDYDLFFQELAKDHVYADVTFKLRDGKVTYIKMESGYKDVKQARSRKNTALEENH